MGVEETVRNEIVNMGSKDCTHPYICYIDNAFDGQAFWCDMCAYQEQMDYNPGEKLVFPPHAYIRTGGRDGTYAWQANAEGIVTEILPIEKVIKVHLDEDFRPLLKDILH